LLLLPKILQKHIIQRVSKLNMKPVTNTKLKPLTLCISGFQELTGPKADYLPSPVLGLGECTHPPCPSRRSSRWAAQREGDDNNTHNNHIKLDLLSRSLIVNK